MNGSKRLFVSFLPEKFIYFPLNMSDTYKHKGQRNELVALLRQKGIEDLRILEAIGKIPRHFFMDSAFEQHAYQDKPFPIGEGQTISQPYTVAFQTTLLQVQPGHKVLEIGTGSGYQACVLAELGAQVYSVEIIRHLYLKTRRLLNQLGYQVRLLLADGSKGAEAFAPFDRILVTAGAPSVPADLVKQLSVGGILVIPVGNQQEQRMIRLTKISESQIRKEDLGAFAFVKLTGEKGWKD